MTPKAQRIQRVATATVIYYFAAFTALCWFLDVAFPGKLATQMRLRLFFDAGVISGLLAFLCSIALWRRRRWIAVIGFTACLVWTLWTMLPRL